MHIRLVMVLVALYSIELNAQLSDKESNVSKKKIVKIETKIIDIYNYYFDKDPNGKNRRNHRIVLYNADEKALEKRNIADDGTVMDTIRYEYDDQGREVKKTRTSSIMRKKYSTTEYLNGKIKFERDFKNRRHLLEKRVFLYPSDSTVLIEKWSNENKIIGKEVRIIKNAQIFKISTYLENGELDSYSKYVRDGYGNVIKEEILYSGHEIPYIYEYDIEYDRFGNYIKKTRKQNGLEDGHTERRTIYYDDTVVPEYSTSNFVGKWVSEEPVDTLVIDAHRIDFTNNLRRRLDGQWEHDKVENLIKVLIDSNRKKKRREYHKYYFKLTNDELHISNYTFHGKHMIQYRRLTE